jgi:hypothetical protein
LYFKVAAASRKRLEILLNEIKTQNEKGKEERYKG